MLLLSTAVQSARPQKYEPGINVYCFFTLTMIDMIIIRLSGDKG